MAARAMGPEKPKQQEETTINAVPRAGEVTSGGRLLDTARVCTPYPGTQQPSLPGAFTHLWTTIFLSTTRQ
jgi:hypothetical protein